MLIRSLFSVSSGLSGDTKPFKDLEAFKDKNSNLVSNFSPVFAFLLSLFLSCAFGVHSAQGRAICFTFNNAGLFRCVAHHYCTSKAPLPHHHVFSAPSPSSLTVFSRMHTHTLTLVAQHPTQIQHLSLWSQLLFQSSP